MIYVQLQISLNLPSSPNKMQDYFLYNSIWKNMFQYQILCMNRKGICIRGRVHYLHIHCLIFFYYICSHFFQIMHHGIFAFPFPSYRFLNTQHPSLFFQYWSIQTDRHTGIFFYLKLLLPIYCTSGLRR